MWMQKSLEGMSIASPGSRLHSRNNQPVSTSMSQSNGSSLQGYGDRPYVVDQDNGTWKSKLIESGQWLGEKVIEYGGRIVRGNSHSSIPNQLAQQQPRNDGRANWMADIRNSSSSYVASSVEGGCMAYQNEFKTTRPSAYSDSMAFGNTPTSMADTQSPDFYGELRKGKVKSKSKRNRQKEKKEKKDKTKSRKKKADDGFDSASYSESDKSMPDSKSSFYSDSCSESDSKSSRVRSRKAVDKTKTAHVNRHTQKVTKSKKYPKSSASVSTTNMNAGSIDFHEKKSRNLRTKKREKKSISARKDHNKSLSDSTSSEKVVTSTKKSIRRKHKTQQSVQVVDLLGVEELVIDGPNVTRTIASQSVAPLSDIFSPQEPESVVLESLNDLHFPAKAEKHTESAVLSGTTTRTSTAASNMVLPASADTVKNVDTPTCTILPENNLVNLDALVADKRSDSEHGATSKKSLNDLRREHQQERPISSMNAMSNPTDPRNISYVMVPVSMSMPFASVQQAPQQLHSQSPQHVPVFDQHRYHSHISTSHEEQRRL